MSTWSYAVTCRGHDENPCDCEHKIDTWSLRNDQHEEIGIVQRFYSDGHFYGVTPYGRTGAMDDRLRCQAAVERMLVERAHPDPGSLN